MTCTVSTYHGLQRSSGGSTVGGLAHDLEVNPGKSFHSSLTRKSVNDASLFLLQHGCRGAQLVFVNLLPGNPLRHGLFGDDREINASCTPDRR